MDEHRALVRATLKALEPFDALERGHLATALDWVDSGAELCRRLAPDVPSPHLVSYFAIVDLDREAILLVEHRKAGLWLPSGGHVEPGEDPAETVRREAREELSIEVMSSPAPVFLTVQRTVGANQHIDVSLWHAVPAEAGTAFTFDEGEFHSVQWFPFDGLPVQAAEPHLARFVAKLRT